MTPKEVKIEFKHKRMPVGSLSSPDLVISIINISRIIIKTVDNQKYGNYDTKRKS